jgi:hypothetical protein
MATPNGYGVIKTDMTCPFYVRHHVNVHPNAFITFVKMDTRKSLIILGLPPLQLATKNKFWLPILWQPKNFGHQACDDQKIFVATRLAIENFSSPFFRCVTMALPFK